LEGFWTSFEPDVRRPGHVSKPFNFILIINPSIIDPSGRFLDLSQQMIDEIHAVPPAPGNDRVLIPGEIESRIMERYKKEGVPLPEAVYRSLSRTDR
jgi:ureidoglycolate dehydrogenase (NAD+)